MAAAARQDAAARHREGPHRLRRGDQGGNLQPPSLQAVAGEHPAHPRRPFAGRAEGAAPRRHAARSPAGVRLHPGRHQAPDVADGDDRPGGRRLDGHRHADLGDVGQVEAALHLFQAELRAGHQPADRSDPRGAGDEPGVVHRPAAQHLRPGRQFAAEAARGAPADPDQWRSREDPLDRPCRGPLRHQDARRHLRGRKGRGRHAGGARPAVQPRRGGRRRRLQHHRAVRPAGRSGPHRDPVAAGDGGRAPSPDPQGPAHLGRAGRRIGRAARSASFLLPRRLRRRGDQPLPRLRHAARHAQARRDAEGGRRLRGRLPLHQVDRQGHPQGDVQDGHLDLPVLLRRADLRCRRPVERLRRQVLHRHRHDDRGRRAGGDRRGDGAAPHQRVRQRSGAEERARIRRRICAAAARREPCLVVRNRVDAAACGPQGLVRDVRRVFEAGQPRGGARPDHPRPVQDQDGGRHRAPARGARGGRAGEGDRQAVLDRRDVVRLDQPRGAHHAGARHERDRRQVEHRRGRRGAGPLHAACRRVAQSGALGDQAGRVGTVRRHRRISRQLAT